MAKPIENNDNAKEFWENLSDATALDAGTKTALRERIGAIDASAITDHVNAVDPHGDRAYADSLLADATSEATADTIVKRDNNGGVKFAFVRVVGGSIILGSDGGSTTSINDGSTADRQINLPDESGIFALTTSNVASATALQTARTINGVSFDGTANINVTVSISTGVSGLGSNVAVALEISVGNPGAVLTNGGTATGMTFTGSTTYASGATFTYGGTAAATHRAALGVASVITRSRTADAAAVTSQTLAADTALTTPLEAATTYKIDFFVHTTQTGWSTMRFDFTGTLDAATAINDIAGYSTQNSFTLLWTSISPPQLTLFSNHNASATIRTTGTIQLRTATAGDFRFLYSAGTGAGGGNAGSVISKMNQYIIATKLSS
jgi:hypothetical protein